jgi:hypothetical protein
MCGAPRGPPWGWIVSSPDQKPEDLDAILRGAGGLQGLAVQLGQGGPEPFEPAAANGNAPDDHGGFWADRLTDLLPG